MTDTQIYEMLWLKPLAQTAQLLRLYAGETHFHEVPCSEINLSAFKILRLLAKSISKMNREDLESLRQKRYIAEYWNLLSHELAMWQDMNPECWQKRTVQGKKLERMARFLQDYIEWECDSKGINKNLYIPLCQDYLFRVNNHTNVDEPVDFVSFRSLEA